MNFIDKLERKFSKYAIHGLMRHIVIFNIVVFLLATFTSENFLSWLNLDPDLVLKGQVWRVFTFLFIPGTMHPVWILFSLYLMYFLGDSLEMYWGSFRLNLYYFMGVIAIVLASLITKTPVSSTFLNASIFLAFAFINPDLEFLVFFILPIKVKFLAYIQWFGLAINTILLIVTFLGLPIYANPLIMLIFKYIPIEPVAALPSAIPFFIFFGPEIINTFKGNKRTKATRAKFEATMPKFDGSTSLHKCELCGITDKDDPNMEFRYCSKCTGLHEYCMKHITNHKHVE